MDALSLGDLEEFFQIDDGRAKVHTPKVKVA